MIFSDEYVKTKMGDFLKKESVRLINIGLQILKNHIIPMEFLESDISSAKFDQGYMNIYFQVSLKAVIS